MGKDIYSKEKDDKFVKAFKDNGFEVDMRTYKAKKTNCTNRSCQYAKKKEGQGQEKKFSHLVQREVDTAIAIRPLKTFYKQGDD